MTLQNCHCKTVALIIEVQGKARKLQGNATYLHDRALGNCLSIDIDDPHSQGVNVVLREDEWQGQIRPSDAEGCFALIELKKSDR